MIDPNENLERQERLLIQIEQSSEVADRIELRLELARVRQAMTDWLVSGGFEPTWERWPVASLYWRAQVR
jgi:hypothetical protein